MFLECKKTIYFIFHRSSNILRLPETMKTRLPETMKTQINREMEIEGDGKE